MNLYQRLLAGDQDEDLLADLATLDPRSDDCRYLFGLAIGNADLPALRVMLRSDYQIGNYNPYLMTSKDHWAVVRLLLEADLGTPEQQSVILHVAVGACQYDVVEWVAPRAPVRWLHGAMRIAILRSDREAALQLIRLGNAPYHQHDREALIRLLGDQGWWEIRRMSSATYQRIRGLWPIEPDVGAAQIKAGLAIPLPPQLVRYVTASL